MSSVTTSSSEAVKLVRQLHECKYYMRRQNTVLTDKRADRQTDRHNLEQKMQAVSYNQTNPSTSE